MLMGVTTATTLQRERLGEVLHAALADGVVQVFGYRGAVEIGRFDLVARRGQWNSRVV